MLIRVSMAYYFIDFSPNCCSFFFKLSFHVFKQHMEYILYFWVLIWWLMTHVGPEAKPAENHHSVVDLTPRTLQSTVIWDWAWMAAVIWLNG